MHIRETATTTEDEDGFLLEMRKDDSGTHEPVALVDPDVTGTT
ncbi:hypothetical protein ABZ078_40335 [Streptomyces sp. NPDC006385]